MTSESNETPKPRLQMRELLLSISAAAKQVPQILKGIAEINGQPTNFDQVVLVVDPHDGSITFWNANALIESRKNQIEELDAICNTRRRQLTELDGEIKRSRQCLDAITASHPFSKYGTN